MLLKAKCSSSRAVLHRGHQNRSREKAADIFCDKIMPLVSEAYHEDGELLCGLSSDAFYEEWHAMTERTGLRKELTPYCCQHTTPTMLAEENVQPAIIQEIMGHTSYSMTAEHYTHISGESKIEALNKLK